MAAATDDDGQLDGRRSSIEKPPAIIAANSKSAAFKRLPDEIIEQILFLTDAGSFASLLLLNSKWRSISQQAHLYAYHLSHCPSYSASHDALPLPIEEDSLPELRRAFAQEVKRNLFAAYRCPSRTVIKLVSNAISSSSCPGGEGMQFSPSPTGHHLLAYNSSRIYVIDVRGSAIEVKRELKILRRPAATCIKDDGSVLCVLLTEMQVDIYDLNKSPPRRTQSIILDHSPRAIALSPCGTVLAAAYEGGIEVTSVHPGALATDRRAVKCDHVDALAFSFDGTQILGTTVHSAQPTTVILTAPYYDPGSHIADDNVGALWTTSILFPNTSRDCSHAVLLQNSSREEASWTFTYDRSFETFRAVRIDDLRNGTTYFTGPVPTATTQGKLLPCTLASASYHGELVSASFQGKDIWLYGVPEDLDAVPKPSAVSSEGISAINSLNRRNSGPSVRSCSRIQQEPPAEARVPQWQVLCDTQRNTMVAGCKIAELPGVSTTKWVRGFGGSALKERLVVAARGVLPERPITEEDGIDFIDGGRLILVDFDYGFEDGRLTEITIEVGTDDAEVLEEETRDIETEVAIVRRRTVAQRGGHRGAVMRAATSAGRAPPVPQVPVMPTEEQMDDPLMPRTLGRSTRPPVPDMPMVTDEGETASMIEEQEALDAPYSHASPRSGTTLRRAATAAAVNRRLHPTPAAGGAHIQYRRADGRAEHPHESDADNWVPPPPPYQKDDPQDLPSFLRHNVPVVNLNDGPAPASAQNRQVPTQPPGSARPAFAQPQPMPARSQTTAPMAGPRQHVGSSQTGGTPFSHQRLTSDSSLVPPVASGSARPISSVSIPSDDADLYDPSPPQSPVQAATRPATSVRNPSGGSTLTTSSGSSVAPPAPPVPQQQVTVSPTLAAPSVVSRPSAPTVPRIQTGTANTTIPRNAVAPALDLHIPSPTFSSTTIWNTPQSSTDSPSNRGLPRASQTWPKPPPSLGPPAVLPAGYPYSAPPTDLNANQMIANAYPPAPRPEQLASLHRHGQTPPPNTQRLSGAFQVPRVPVGSRDSRRFSGNSQPLHSPSRHPLQQHPPGPAPALYHPRPQRAAAASDVNRELPPPPPVEDQPLIISTPKGVTGAFDPPGLTTSTHRAETPILAPVPRHPRANETSAVLGHPRPPVEPLETTFSAASAPLHPHGGAPPPSNGVLAGYLPPASQSQSTLRQSSLNRRGGSRAERSAAKNMADAKRRGWRRSKSKRRSIRKRENNADAASSAAWTDVTASSSGATAYLAQQQQEQQGQGQGQGHGQGQYGYQQGGGQGGSKGKGKCVVM